MDQLIVLHPVHGARIVEPLYNPGQLAQFRRGDVDHIKVVQVGIRRVFQVWKGPGNGHLITGQIAPDAFELTVLFDIEEQFALGIEGG